MAGPTISTGAGGPALVPAPSVVTGQDAANQLGDAKAFLGNTQNSMATQSATVAANKANPAVSIVDLLTSQGQPSDYASRSKLASTAGIQNYVGSAEQNAALINYVNNQQAKSQQQTESNQSKDGGVSDTLKSIQSAIGGTNGGTSGQTIYRNAQGDQINVGDPTINADLIRQITAQGYQPTNQANGNTDYNKMSLDQARTIFGNDFTGIHPNGDGTYKADQTALNRINTSTGQAKDESFQSKFDAVQNKIDEAYTKHMADVDSIKNGTFPLTPAQQSMVDSIQKMFDKSRQAQLIANKNYEGAITEAGISAGRNRYAPEIEAGNIFKAVSAGISKINDLDAQAAMSIAKLELGFQQDNYKIVSEAYADTNKYLTDKANAIVELHKDTVAALKDARDFSYRQTQDAITNSLNSQKFDYQKTKDFIDQQHAQGVLDETHWKNAQDLLIKQAELKIKQDAAQLLSGAMSSPVTMTNGVPNPAEQEKFLKQYSPEMQTLIKGIADYSLDPNGASKRAGGLTPLAISAIVKAYDDTYDSNQYKIRGSFLKNWKVGGQNSVIQAANTSIQHIGELSNYLDKLGNADAGALGPFTSKYNSTLQWINENSQDPNVKQFKQTAVALASEMARIYKNGTGSNAAPTDDEIGNQLGILTTDLSPSTGKAVLETGVKLMVDRLNTARENYQSVMGKPPSSILFPSAQKTIEALKAKGYDINTDSLDPTPLAGSSDADLFSSVTPSTTHASSTEYLSNLLNTINSPIQ